jgi:hypothetical protein
VAEAKSLLATPTGQETVRQFFREWSGYTRVQDVVKTTATGFDAVAPQMTEETRRFIDDVIWNQGGSVKTLLTANTTVINGGLAQFYGFGAPGADYATVTRPAEWSIGLLAQGSVLAGNAQSNSSSPTLRGLTVYERLFCNERPTPPANVPRIEEPQLGAKTTRERFEDSHVSDPTCDSCLRYFDPIGFAFEHFDEVGRYRATEGGLAIDATGAAISPEDESVLMTFDGLTDLATQAAADPGVTDCVSGLIAAYLFAGGGGVACLAEEARAGLASDEFGLAEYLAQVAAAPHFTRRR